MQSEKSFRSVFLSGVVKCTSDSFCAWDQYFSFKTCFLVDKCSFSILILQEDWQLLVKNENLANFNLVLANV